MERFERWCESQGQTAWPALPQTLIEFIRSKRSAGWAGSEIRSSLEALAREHVAHGLKNPLHDPVVGQELAALEGHR